VAHWVAQAHGLRRRKAVGYNCDRIETVKPLKTEVAYETPWFNLLAKTMREGEPPYYSLSVADYVGILAITTDHRILAVRQYRPAVERFTIEFPAGLVDAGENPLETAHRELLEETAHEAESVELLGEMLTDTGRLTNRIWACMATGVRPAEGYRAEDGMETLSYSLPALMTAMAEGEFNHSLHVAIVMLAVAKGALHTGQ
jgi:ADP-ribose pyrophosphatase